MTRADITTAALATLPLAMIAGLYGSTFPACFDGPCGFDFILGTALIAAVLAAAVTYPIALVAIRAWHRATGRP